MHICRAAFQTRPSSASLLLTQSFDARAGLKPRPYKERFCVEVFEITHSEASESGRKLTL
jgi:hypothetical protein